MRDAQACLAAKAKANAATICIANAASKGRHHDNGEHLLRFHDNGRRVKFNCRMFPR
jgi:hypothetical protein